MTILELQQQQPPAKAVYLLQAEPDPVCPRCVGRGRLPVTWQVHRGCGTLEWVCGDYRPCPACGGSGKRFVEAPSSHQEAS